MLKLKVILLVVIGYGLRMSGFGKREYIEFVVLYAVVGDVVTRIFILLSKGCGGWYLLLVGVVM